MQDRQLEDFDVNTCTCQYTLNLIFLVDASGSMTGEPINQINRLTANAIEAAEEMALEKDVQLSMRVAKFNSGANWIFGNTEEGVEYIDWRNINTSRRPDTAGAIDLATSVMHRKYLGAYPCRPIVVLITNSPSNDRQKTEEAVARLKSSMRRPAYPYGDAIIRIAIGGAGAEHTELVNFASIGNIEHPDGTIDENVPLVFGFDKAFDNIKDIIRSGLRIEDRPIGIDDTPNVVISLAGLGDDAGWDL